MDKQVNPNKEQVERRKNAMDALTQKFKKANPNASDQEIKEKVNQIISQFEKANKKNILLEQKSQKEIRKEQRDAQKEIATLNYQSATNVGDKLKAAGTILKADIGDAADNLKKALSSASSNLGAAFDGNIEQYASLYGKYQSSIDARMQGLDGKIYGYFSDMAELTRKNLAASPYLKQSDMLESLNSLIDQGIAFNVEQRAFLETVSDKIVTTFDSFSSSLMRIIKLQGADSTAARMGMEAYLTQMLNNYYEDSSYLNSNFDAVQDTLFNLSSSLSKEESVELEYVVQKWLGSMSSVGVSDATIQQLASAINALGTGDIESLQSNQMQNLIVMASGRAGLSYSEMLTQGLNADNVNALMESIIEYVQELGKSNNKVLRQQYANIFGVDISDLAAAVNLNTDTLKKVSEANLTYSNMIDETNKQMSYIQKRMHLSEQLDNVYENFMTGVAGNIAGNAVGYMTWRALDVVEDLTGGIAIPTVSVMGSGVDLETTVVGLMKSSIAGISILAQGINALGNLGNGGSLNLDLWGDKNAVMQRGSGFMGLKSGVETSTSVSSYIGNANTDEMSKYAITSAKEEGEEEIRGSQEAEDSTTNLLKKIIAIMENNLQEFEDSTTSDLKKIIYILSNNFGYSIDDRAVTDLHNTGKIINKEDENNPKNLLKKISDLLFGEFEDKNIPVTVKNLVPMPVTLNGETITTKSNDISII